MAVNFVIVKALLVMDVSSDITFEGKPVVLETQNRNEEKESHNFKTIFNQLDVSEPY